MVQEIDACAQSTIQAFANWKYQRGVDVYGKLDDGILFKNPHPFYHDVAPNCYQPSFKISKTIIKLNAKDHLRQYCFDLLADGVIVPKPI